MATITLGHSDVMPDSDAKADCYSAGERSAMQSWQQWRARLLAPLLRVLNRCRITADHLTLFSLAAGVAFCPLYLLHAWSTWHHTWWPLPAALAMLLLHVLLDALDGPLARHQGGDSRAGSLTDSMVDQVVVAVSMLTLMYTGTVDVFAGGWYIFVYTVVIQMAMVRNALAIPFSWLFRPRLLVYAWIAVELWLPGSLNLVLWLCNALLTVKAVTGFYNLRQRL